MSLTVRVGFEITVDSPATLTAYGIAFGYALQSAAVNAVKVADAPGAKVSTGQVSLELATGERHG